MNMLPKILKTAVDNGYKYSLSDEGIVDKKLKR